MPLNSRQKGARFERAVAQELRNWGYGARRGQQFSGSPDSPDVVSEDFPYQIEAKAVEKLNLDKAYKQAKDDAEGSNKPPVVIHKRNRGTLMITLSFEDFMKLLQRKENNEHTGINRI